MNTHDAALAAEPEVADARRAAELIDRMCITTNAELQVATSWIAEIKTKAEEVDAKRRGFVDPLNGVIKQINDFFRPALDSLKAAEAALKGKIQTHVSDNLEQRDQLLAQVADTDHYGARAELITKASALVPEKVDGLSIRESWTGEVSDAAMLMDWAIANRRHDLLLINEKALAALTKAAGRDPVIPGWRAIVKRTVAVTASKVRS